ncbi:diacylglycerol kinase family protein [Pediococcus acidilactici]|uniref:Diacylglycerol kinase family protein n=1 Tax=Pediococcus acidilactici TaxID=1254 RepID=A0AAW8YHP7_PEDAC|nr:diacylglycerol kinase family protein [Pediococcus acidilactici]MDD9323682.1 diacylglycerol kinase family protein [Pediococcus acidilactici]MDV2622040.1 diacylglycerol kinase family protein [Pediococcus acidilactici]GAC46473.1 hypothetical protein PLO_1945 [Pediococcus acidilactici NGRI 0510Q]
MKYYFIINKWAGARHSAETWQKMHHLLVQNQVEFDSVVTEYPRHATELAQQFATSHRKGVDNCRVWRGWHPHGSS